MGCRASSRVRIPPFPPIRKSCQHGLKAIGGFFRPHVRTWLSPPPWPRRTRALGLHPGLRGACPGHASSQAFSPVSFGSMSAPWCRAWPPICVGCRLQLMLARSGRRVLRGSWWLQIAIGKVTFRLQSASGSGLLILSSRHAPPNHPRRRRPDRRPNRAHSPRPGGQRSRTAGRRRLLVRLPPRLQPDPGLPTPATNGTGSKLGGCGRCRAGGGHSPVGSYVLHWHCSFGHCVRRHQDPTEARWRFSRWRRHCTKWPLRWVPDGAQGCCHAVFDRCVQHPIRQH